MAELSLKRDFRGMPMNKVDNTPDESIDLYAPVAIQVGTPIPIVIHTS